MESTRETVRYKWSQTATHLLIRIWSNEKIFEQLQMATRKMGVWCGIAKLMTRKGFPVSALQCRTRIKNMSSLYHYAVARNNKTLIEPYFDIFSKLIPMKNVTIKLKAKKAKEEIRISDSEDEEINVEDTQGNLETPIQRTKLNTMYLENLIRRSVASEVKIIREEIADSFQRIERAIAVQTERLESALAKEEHRRVQQEMRVSRLLNRLDSMAVPQLKYMGDLVERQAVTK